MTPLTLPQSRYCKHFSAARRIWPTSLFLELAFHLQSVESSCCALDAPILRELMANVRTFNNIHRGIPLI
jgi:hypothetical protein